MYIEDFSKLRRSKNARMFQLKKKHIIFRIYLFLFKKNIKKIG